MKIKKLYTKNVEAPLISGKIHGQGPSKKYAFVIMETDEGVGIAELYPGTYNQRLMDACLVEIQKRSLNFNFINETMDIKKALHIPFISGNGIYQACVSAVINCKYMMKRTYDPKDTKSLHPYYSGGTVKSSLVDLEFEANHAAINSYYCYKVRLDYRNELDCIQKIQFLNGLDINYAVDFIVNTNFEDHSEEQILKLVKHMDPTKVEWLEEPCAPFQIFERKTFLTEIRNQGFKVAFGESFTSTFEIDAIDQGRLIDVLQLDATINCNIGELIQIAKNCQTKLSMHNWGSVITSHANKIVATNLDKDIFFEIPYYKTLFDEQITAVLEECEQLIDSTHAEKILTIIEKFSSEKIRDFRWT